MTPAISCPGTLGYLISGNKPSFVTESPWQIPHACTLMRTFPLQGSGIFRSTISNGPLGFETCTERILVFVSNCSYLEYSSAVTMHVSYINVCGPMLDLC